MKRKIRFLILIISIFFTLSCAGRKNGTATYDFTGIRRGNIERFVSSSGTINPVSAVKVLPRMSGKVETVLVDYNDTVYEGQVLARLNTDMLRLQRDQQQVNVQKAKANYELQLTNYRTQQLLAERELISEFELRSSKTSLDNLAADLAVAEQNLKKIETEINQFAYITSPIDGIVLDRNINVGDTVVDSSSNNSSSIFTIAANLRDMQIEASVGELDVTSIHKGQTVRFTLESLPGRKFSGIVDNLRMVPVVQSNVVSYTVIINVENLDGSLLPGMTCAVDFIVESAEDVLMVQNAALRYQPLSLSQDEIDDMIFAASLAELSQEEQKAALEARAAEKAAASSQGKSSSNGITNLMMGPAQNTRIMGGGGGTRQRQTQNTPQQRAPEFVTRYLWYLNDDGKLAVMQVKAGLSDGNFTQIVLSDEMEGRQVILREVITMQK